MDSQQEPLDQQTLAEALCAILGGLATQAPVGDTVEVLVVRDAPRPPPPDLAEEMLRAQSRAFYRMFHAYAKRVQGDEENPAPPAIMYFLLNGMGWLGVDRTRRRLTVESLSKIWARGLPAMRACSAEATSEVDLLERYAAVALEGAMVRFRRHMAGRGLPVPAEFETWFQHTGPHGSVWWVKTCAKFRRAFREDPKLSVEWVPYAATRRAEAAARRGSFIT
jgi:hypothetical protein